jgi:hypothetical protein
MRNVSTTPSLKHDGQNAEEERVGIADHTLGEKGKENNLK